MECPEQVTTTRTREPPDPSSLPLSTLAPRTYLRLRRQQQAGDEEQEQAAGEEAPWMHDGAGWVMLCVVYEGGGMW
jgi:hypothetical protein